MLQVVVHRTNDFELSGKGSAPSWEAATWQPILPVKGSGTYQTRAKVLYSATGIYCLFDCEDRMLVNTGLGDQADLWREDVVEAFFWPDERCPVYLEYELSPLNAELVLMVPNREGVFMGWQPWHYQGERRARHATAVRGGTSSAGCAVSGWSAEFFLPFALFTGLTATSPASDTLWRANFCRIDHDDGQETLFSWSPGITHSFHNLQHFGSLRFAL